MVKDQSARDKAMEKLVATRLQAQVKDQWPNCPDAGTLAAYVEQALTPGERLACETHFAACGRCQGVVAQLVRFAEGEEPAEAHAALRPRGAKALGLRWVWAGPALVALVITGLWYAGELGLRRPPQMVEKAARPALPSVGTPKETTQATDKLAPSAPMEGEKAEGGKWGPAGAPGTLAAPSGTPGPAIKASENFGRELRGTRAGEEPGNAGIPSVRGAPAEAATPPAAGMPRVPAEAIRKPRFAAKAEVKESAPRVSPAPLRSGALLAQKAQAPEKTGMWRVGPRGLIQKADSQGNWVTQGSGVQTDLLAISSPNSSVAWAVGQSGTVLRTTDGGATWTEIRSPTSEDLVGVVAANQQTARLATRTGQEFETTDGGETWSRAPSQ